jgi:hypothetical protein
MIPYSRDILIYVICCYPPLFGQHFPSVNRVFGIALELVLDAQVNPQTPLQSLILNK